MEILNGVQPRFIAAKNWRGLYDTFSPKEQAACPYDKFLVAINSSAQSSPDFDISRFSVEQLKVRVTGDQGFATYVGKFDGRVVDTASDSDPDIFVRVNGAWYDDLDSHSPFGC